MNTLRIKHLISFLLVLSLFASCKSSSEKSAEERIEREVTQLKSQLPMRVDEATVLTNVEYKDEMMVYYYTYDESILSYYNLLTTRDQRKQSMITLMSTNKEFKGLIKNLKEAGAGLQFNYKGSQTGKKLTIEIESSEF